MNGERHRRYLHFLLQRVVHLVNGSDVLHDSVFVKEVSAGTQEAKGPTKLSGLPCAWRRFLMTSALSYH